MTVKVSSKAVAQEILDKYDNFLFDCDGVLWRESSLLPKVAETLKMLRKHNKNLIFVTNNATKSRLQYSKKFEKFGLTVSESEVFGSSYASAVYLRDILKLPKDKKVWVEGADGLEIELQDAGYQTLGGTHLPALDRPLNMEDKTDPINNIDPEVGAVVVGLDPKIIITESLSQCSKGALLPGAGMVVKAVETCVNREGIICGKPSKGMMDAIIKSQNIDKSRSIMIGDRFDTDILFGLNNGLSTLLVLSGIETPETLEALDPKQKPTYYANKLGDLYEYNH
ncbi:hypothetical protein BRETT_003211 [Brettanomyces bruxellensis]|uniref:4-nitrophenylphosphatase n=1 Tax=Dekkera bruxellensis TaxID=5007 RepID=A0A871RL58_DEKBR|nr:uncharacterized protein BRETT_003211 [Brettanomyces bruxellensis]QOU23021.1 hypothetical protein BRETT_003211 [Brettanomyces bruxellensis]